MKKRGHGVENPAAGSLGAAPVVAAGFSLPRLKPAATRLQALCMRLRGVAGSYTLQLRSPRTFSCDASFEGEEPGVNRLQVRRQRPTDLTEFRIFLQDAVPSLVEQAIQERPEE